MCRASMTTPSMSSPICGCITAFDARAEMTSPPLGPYRVSAYNTAHDSENKIHDDSVARRFGFGGGLVPGVDVYGYMTHLPVLSRNVALGPWIHTGSRVQYLATAAVGDTLSVRARITGNWEHKQHRFVELDALVLAGEMTPVAHITHTAIYRPRQVAAA